MDAAGPSSRSAGIVTRAGGMLLRPASTLAAAADEPASIRELYLGYIVPLAAIGPVCEAAGLLIFGPSIAGIQLRVRPLDALAGAAVDYASSLLATWLVALTISGLAPAFGGRVDRTQAVKLVALSGTAVWLAGAFDLYPTLGLPMAILGALYSLYGLYFGLPRLMRAPGDRTLTYFAAVFAGGALLALVLRLAGGLVG